MIVKYLLNENIIRQFFRMVLFAVNRIKGNVCSKKSFYCLKEAKKFKDDYAKHKAISQCDTLFYY